MSHKVLIVDDSPMIFKLLKKKLESNGITDLLYAEDGLVAVQQYNENKPDLVIMDITMPVKDGLEASKEILRMDEHAKIILLSSLHDEDLVDKAKTIGVREFLSKPFDPEQAYQKICSVLAHD